ncbi:M23 family metallopeptidase [Pseudoxanthomonas winnipegensis]|jgi:murein DD-endopeptidase MepM/ murein hydrolase activator NlpD|uniref:M23 family metallopeptidase n=1 Tax=Pseudoxanthomonas winnipegensis TaxID=2480810 RepID=A0ABY1WD30_9GAMM|nr:M23 family metallopeptidase [Pseudoxanthomonas winnipegensis]TAA12338.1 M23 family metallopeptidase [Pseudoxanthomonas winnipegensis]TAA19297.1 M23 family metallopeptidase [Pseudoxanthomonas winnipegensis]TAH70557.1 M23 family metallopeptidase [Pseudoxanthomonas winnipegensis]
MRFLLTLLLGIVIGAVGLRLVERTHALRAVGLDVQPTSTPGTAAAAVDAAVARTAPTTPALQMVGDVQPTRVAVEPVSPQAPVGDDTDSPAMPAVAPQLRAPDDGQGLLVPVQGVARSALRDTFTDARSAGRVHDAIDIMAPAGTPVLAVADGTVEKLFDSKRGGLTIYQFEPSGRLAYYYAHLERYADGLQEKRAIKRGQVIGYVGSTGNASPDAPHLHFAIFQLGPEKQWWKGTAVNPYPVLHDSAPVP